MFQKVTSNHDDEAVTELRAWRIRERWSVDLQNIFYLSLFTVLDKLTDLL
jgi:hypothetical protein